MIIRWIRRSATEYVAVWQEVVLSLEYNATGDSKWSVVVGGARCRQRWVHAEGAMDGVDWSLQRQIVKLGAEVAARQGTYSKDTPFIHRRFINAANA
jgi:hypothetical protein